MNLTRSLEDYRHERLLDVAEFATWLGVTRQTYRRLLTQPVLVRMATKRQVRDRLGVPAQYIAELIPPASPVLQAQVTAIIAEADQEGWIVYDPDTGQATGERLHATEPVVTEVDA